MLANTTLQEAQDGFESLDVAGLSIGVLTIVNFHAKVDFFSGKTKRWNGDISPGTFKLSVEATLKQFPSVRTVTVMVDGDPDFGSLA